MKFLSALCIRHAETATDCRTFENTCSHLSYAFSSDYIILYCASGTAAVSLVKKTVILKGDDCLLIPPYVLHRISFDSFGGSARIFKKTYIQQHFSEAFSQKLLAACPNDVCHIENCQKNAPLISKCSSTDFTFIDLARFLILIEKGDTRQESRNTFPLRNSTLLKIVDYIAQNTEANLTVAQIAEIFSVSEAHICRLFKKELELTPTALITACRMSRAAALLAETERSIKQICEMCVFSSHTHFQTLFKKSVGVTPKEYRLMQS